MHKEAGPQITDQTIALVKRVMDALANFSPSSLNANGVFHHPATQLATLKAARDNIEKAIAMMEGKWGKAG